MYACVGGPGMVLSTYIIYTYYTYCNIKMLQTSWTGTSTVCEGKHSNIPPGFQFVSNNVNIFLQKHHVVSTAEESKYQIIRVLEENELRQSMDVTLSEPNKDN